MNLDQFNFHWLFTILAFWCFYVALKPSKKYHKIDKFLRYANGVLGITCLVLSIWLTYQSNYINNGYSNIAKITLYTCTKDNKTIEQDCEYIGAITYRPYMRELMITTTPLYPILNCPSPNNRCVQERIFVDKGNVKSLEKLN
ncbi:hypothetical protein [Moraxella equi]|uniref:Uncharacterized protein n=1 Tax=Moraxella equi TaxID=60442 RepID=A0A378UT54_9GAMM|nr:hypothetical protein [Moraxella equi]OPH37662.1 hypothetical protein B5J93_08045 [Moraxella equi]STZ82924.1 Uncharacterised protein [Moraxella equi]